MEDQTSNEVVKIGDWMVTYLITAIPFVGIIMLFVWAFGGGTNASKANWAKASLLWGAIAMAMGIFFFAIFGAAMFSAFGRH